MNKVASASNLRPGQANRAARFPRKAYACSLVAAVVLVLGSMMRSGVQPRQPTLVRGHAAAAVNQTVQTAASKGETPSGASVLWPSSDVTDDVVDAEAAALALEEEEAEQHREQEDAAVQPAATQQRRQDPPVRRSAEGASHRKAEEEEEGEEVDAANSDLAASPPPAAASAADSPAAQEAGTGEGQVPASQHVPAATGKQDATASHKQTVAGLEGGEEAPAPQEAEPADSVAGRGREAAAPPAAYVLPADAVPKVALMFLSRGWLPHKTVWHEWMKGVDGGVLPVPALARLGCSQEQVDLVQALGTADAGTAEQEDQAGEEAREGRQEEKDTEKEEDTAEHGEEEEGSSGSSKSTSSSKSSKSRSSTLYQRQRLFTIYVHSPPNYTVPFDEDSIFHGREAKNRVPTEWGTHSLVRAVRLMVAEALQDPTNQRFMLMSESDIPLWPPGLTYLQLMVEPASRVRGCSPRNDAEDKRREEWQADYVKFPRQQWRKSSQWFVINRRHAEVFVAESKLDAVFDKECFVRKDMVTWKSKPDDRWCISDEHFLPTILAAVSPESEFSCNHTSNGPPRTSPTYTKWDRGPHPEAFTAAQLFSNNHSVLHTARHAEPAVAQAALQEYGSWLVQPSTWTQQACRRAVKRLARKAASSTFNGTAAAAPPAAAAPANGTEESPAAVAARDWPLALMPPYLSFLTMRKVESRAAQQLVDAIADGLLEAEEL
ncbi:hypothetical protein D9Q98_009388 [Chlorella vulgaris]|uniref:Uncharacterized protein n=1 Tax=Chlorella vulgaris TaxID=3077 RepID=A0A9D4TPI6_CHLVU|nr:hypothetical protein D9Q98_009388 [Chlorella vulgaris]